MNSIIECLSSNGSYYKFKGILQCIKLKKIDEQEKELLFKLKEDNSRIAGRFISEYAIAALDVLGIEKYIGADENILDLIRSFII